MMRSSFIAFLLCGCAAAAGAGTAETQCPPVTVAAARTHHPAADGRPAPELIKTAGAVTQDGPSMTSATPGPKRGAEPAHERRSGTAMLLAALALMSGIALRRYSARDDQ
jgi:hypothetical protein